MEDTPFNYDEEESYPEARKDRSVLYMLIILGAIILTMAYLTMFVEDPLSIFREKKKAVVTVVGDQSKLLNKSKVMTDEEVRGSLVKFIQAFYYDQQKGYFDPPSYFVPITKTFYNFHNLTYESLRDLYWKRMADMKKLERSWDPFTMEFFRTDTGIVVNYWAKEKYFRASTRQQQAGEVKYEMIIDESGKIFSLKELETKNFKSYAVTLQPVAANKQAAVTDKPQPAAAVEKDLKTYDVTVVDIAPHFPGGEAQLERFFKTNLRYPQIAKDKKTQGSVYISFFVEKDGTLRDIQLRQGLGNGCDEEALRLVRSMPSWSPGTIAGNAVNTYFVLPVPFGL